MVFGPKLLKANQKHGEVLNTAHDELDGMVPEEEGESVDDEENVFAPPSAVLSCNYHFNEGQSNEDVCILQEQAITNR